MRDCGSCTLCCTLTYVPELKKPERVTCENCAANCTIYETRPQSCRQYECAWLAGHMSEDMRPDKAGFLTEVYPKMVAVLLKDGMTLDKLSAKALDELTDFIDQGKPVIATGQWAKLPKGMTGEEAKRILLDTVREYRYG